MNAFSRLLIAPLMALLIVLPTGRAARADGTGTPSTPSGFGTIVVDAAHPGAKISPMLYGLMTEEINHSYDGGLYAELIQNRMFKDRADGPAHWSMVQEGGTGSIALDNDHPINNALTTCLLLTIDPLSSWAKGLGRVGVANDGYWGVPIQSNTRYRVSFYARTDAGFDGPLTASLEAADGKATYATGIVKHIGADWKRFALTIKTGPVAASTNGRFVISATKPGSLYLNFVSLFPPTYKNRANGNRIDLMQKLADMHPAFLRLPGGNYLEGNTIAEHFNWRNTLHGLDQRPGHQGPWGYRSTDGLGLLEYLEWCEDLHMQPLLAVFAGYALGGEHVDAGPKLQPFVQEALDEIEYATGDVKTTWGAVRAADGHPSPFAITYVEVGNEDGFDKSGSYDGRFAQFYDAVKAKYPTLQLIATTQVKSRRPDLVDDHYYASSLSMERDLAHRYDNYDRSGPKIFVGEWATTEGSPTPNLGAALADATFLTGLERNSDVVLMSSYAPLLVNVNQGARQWGTNLIGYDNLASFCSPSYYVQQMFNANRGDVALPVSVTQAPSQAAPNVFTGGVGVGAWRTQTEFKDVTVQSASGDQIPIATDSTIGWDMVRGDWSSQDGTLRQSSEGENSLATTGDHAWTDYSVHLQARKVAGAEGFFVLFHVKDRNNYFQWNVGGWGNTRMVIQCTQDGAGFEIGKAVAMSIETGRWYDVRIEVAGHDIKCYLDDKLVTEASDLDAGRVGPVFAGASRDTNGDVILKVINVDDVPQGLQIDLRGVASVGAVASGQEMSGAPDAANSLADPEKIVPQPITLTNAGTPFTHTFPAHSVTVLRVKTK